MVNPIKLVVKSDVIVRNPTIIMATKVKEKVTPPIKPLRLGIILSPKYARQDGNPKPKDTPKRIEITQIIGTLEKLIVSINAELQTPSITHNDNSFLRPIFSTK